jgi:hypothetical protein
MSAPTPLLGKLRSAFSSSNQALTSSDPVSDPVTLSTSLQLSTLEEVLDQVAPVVPTAPAAPDPDPTPPQLTPQVISQAADQLYTQASNDIQQAQQAAAVASGGVGAKERAGGGSNVIEVGTALQYVEQEKSPEIPPEVESYLQHVEDHSAGDPQEIVLADVSATPMATNYPKKSVIVLPITPETEKAGRSKNPSFSIRWLVEWSQRVIKMFAGKVVYRQVES